MKAGDLIKEREYPEVGLIVDLCLLYTSDAADE